MPYRWTTPADAPTHELRLWPHESLTPRGMAIFILATFALILLPAFSVLGTPILWGLLPFLIGAVWAVFYALQRNHKDRQITEVLTLTSDDATLVRTNPRSGQDTWQENRYWVRVSKYADEGPVPNYVTLKGKGREVEIGAFLSEEERIALYEDLTRVLSAR
jgi:uncharacterized membrane protein